MRHDTIRLGKAGSHNVLHCIGVGAFDAARTTATTVKKPKIKPEDCGFIVDREHPEYIVYELEGPKHNWVLLVSRGCNAENALKEIFNHMIAEGIIALYLDAHDLYDLRAQVQGMLH